MALWPAPKDLKRELQQRAGRSLAGQIARCARDEVTHLGAVLHAGETNDLHITASWPAQARQIMAAGIRARSWALLIQNVGSSASCPRARPRIGSNGCLTRIAVARCIAQVGPHSSQHWAGSGVMGWWSEGQPRATAIRAANEIVSAGPPDHDAGYGVRRRQSHGPGKRMRDRARDDVTTLLSPLRRHAAGRSLCRCRLVGLSLTDVMRRCGAVVQCRPGRRLSARETTDETLVPLGGLATAAGARY